MAAILQELHSVKQQNGRLQEVIHEQAVRVDGMGQHINEQDLKIDGMDERIDRLSTLSTIARLAHLRAGVAVLYRIARTSAMTQEQFKA